jgi:hypothetical protein
LGIPVGAGVSSMGLTQEMANLLSIALTDTNTYVRRLGLRDRLVFTSDILVEFRHNLLRHLDKARITSTEVADSLLRKGEVLLLHAMKEAGTNSRRMDQPRVAKGVQVTPTLAGNLEENGARSFSIRRANSRATSTDPAALAREMQMLNRIFGTALEADSVGKTRAKFNGFMRWMLTLPQMEKENWTVPGVREFTDSARAWWATKGKWTEHFDRWVESVRLSKLGKAELSAIWRFANEVTLLSDQLGRSLTPEEKAREAAKVGGLSPAQLKIWEDGRQLLKDALTELETLAKARAAQVWDTRLAKETDLVAATELQNGRKKAMAELDDDFRKLRNRDYWPLARFGTFTVHMKANKALNFLGKSFKRNGSMLFELYETEGEQQKRKAELLRQYGDSVEVAAGKVDESLYSFMGLPPSVLRMIENDMLAATQEFMTGDRAIDADTMKMFQAQLNALRTAMLHFTPENAFKQRLLRRKGTRGFTDDGLRAMASLGQSFAGHIARAKHRGEMDDSLKILDSHRREMEFSRDPAFAQEGNKLTDLLNYYKRAQRDMMNPGQDLANLRALGFLWYLGIVPRAALVQIAQPIFTTYPWLATRYGDGHAIAEMAKGYALLRRMFRNKTGDLPAHLAHALEQGFEAGILNQSLFTELGGLAEGSNLQRLLPGKFLKSQESASLIRKAGYYAGYLFQKGEELNRLVTFRAAYMLELQKQLGVPMAEVDAKMKELGGTPQAKEIQSLAFTAARSATEMTQGEYARWARPEIMRGKKSAIFLFKMYSQIMTYFAVRDPGAMRFLAIQLAIAGALGLPFAQDLLDILNAATQGRLCDTGNIKDCVRNYINELGANPELVMHGLSRYASPWDLSGSMSLGRVVPMVEPLTAAMMPGGDLESQALRAQSEALGALFSIPLNWMKAASTGDSRDVEMALPTAVRDVYRTMRRMAEGGERGRGGEMMVEIDWGDPLDVAVHLGQAAGFRPSEIAQRQEASWAQRQAERYWQGRRETLVSQYYELKKTGMGDREALADVMEAIRGFNSNVPYREMQISKKQLDRGLKQSKARSRAIEQGTSPAKKYRNLYSEVAEGFALED